MTVALDTENTPNTTNNFVALARWHYYDGTTIFRTDPGIGIIQGGSPHTESAADPGPGYSIPDEPTFETGASGLVGPYRYEPGQLVMARRDTVDGASAQFFFVTGAEASALDASGTYVVFGTTDDAGIAVLRDIIGLHVDDPTSDLGGAPSRTVTINSVPIQEG
ncbi:MAG: peptidylprolyl isomerase [Acidimicrobiales bacterium]